MTCPADGSITVLPKSDQTGLELKCYESSVLKLTVSLGTGYDWSGIPPIVTMQDVATAINGLAGWVAFVSYTAVVNGNQVSTGAITIDAGHSLDYWDVMDVTRSKEESVYLRYTLSSTTAYEFEIVNTTATTVTLNLDTTATSAGTRTFTDNQVIGHGTLPAAILNWQQNAAYSATLAGIVLPFSYWTPVPRACEQSSSPETLITIQDLDDADRRLCVYVDHREVSYIANPKTQEWTGYHGTVEDRYGLLKYDGKDVYLAGLPPKTISSVTDSGAGAALTAGTYKWRRSLQYTDAQANQVEMFVNDEKTVVMANNDATVVLNSMEITTQDGLFNLRYAYANNAGTETGVTFAVDAGGGLPQHTLRAGHYGYVADNGGTLRRFKVTSWTNVSITIEAAMGDTWTSITIPNNAVFCTVLNRVWRTKVNGVKFYLAFECPNNPIVATTTHTDNIADTSLGEELFAPENTQFGLPAANTVAVHQGVLVVAGGPHITKELHWEDTELSIEFSPRSTHNDRIATQYGSDIQSAVSDGDANLVLLTDTSHIAVSGSLPELTYEFANISEGGSGGSSSQALTRAGTAIYSLDSLGPHLVSYGEDAKNWGAQVSPTFLKKDTDALVQLHTDSFISLFDADKHRIHFIAPKIKMYFYPIQLGPGSGGGAAIYTDNRVLAAEYPVISSSKWYIYDTLNKIWYEWAVPISIFPTGGLALAEGKLYTSSFIDGGSNPKIAYTHTQCLFENMSANGQYDESYDFVDHYVDYDWELEPQWDNGDSPSIDKFWQYVKLYQAQAAEFIASFNVLVRTYRNFSKAVVDNTRTLTFSASTSVEAVAKLSYASKARNMLFNLSGTIFRNPPVITGYEYTVIDKSYKDEALKDA